MPKLIKLGSSEVSPCHQVNKQSVSILYSTAKKRRQKRGVGVGRRMGEKIKEGREDEKEEKMIEG